MSPAGRRTGSPPTRKAILDAARAEFAEAGYNGASIRRVARRAGVDPALVYHYFADKAGVFVACLDLPFDALPVKSKIQNDESCGVRIVDQFLAQWEEDQDEPGHSFVVLVQAMSSAPKAALAFRELLTEWVWTNCPGAKKETSVMVAAVTSQLLGLAWSRYLARMEPLASASRAEVAAWVGPTIAKLISSSAAMGNARDATQVHGGYGFVNDSPVAHHYRDSKILEIGEGTREVQKMLISRELGL